VDYQAVESVVDALGKAFNDKDAQSFARLFTDDAEFVTIFGARMRGRAGIEAGHSAVFANALSGNRLVISGIDAKAIGADVALCHAAWVRERSADAPEGSLPPGSGLFTLVFTRTGNGWAIAAATNVQDATPPGR
jgi:uncharacterized protein (TIGR02246 family)